MTPELGIALACLLYLVWWAVKVRKQKTNDYDY